MHASVNFCIPEQEDLNLKPQLRLAPEDAIAFPNKAGLRDDICISVAG